MPKYQSGLGFRDTELFNLAMLAKQAWKLIRDPEALSEKILHSVYYAHGYVLQAELGNTRRKPGGQCVRVFLY